LWLYRVWSKSSLLSRKSAENGNEGNDNSQARIDELLAELDAARAELDAELDARAEFWLNPYALMLEPLPTLTDVSSKAASSSKSVGRVDIQVVKEALNFKSEQMAYTLSIKPEFEKRADVRRYLISEDTASSEMGISATLHRVIFRVLNDLVPAVHALYMRVRPVYLSMRMLQAK
jgi:hypothetical protein